MKEEEVDGTSENDMPHKHTCQTEFERKEWL